MTPDYIWKKIFKNASNEDFSHKDPGPTFFRSLSAVAIPTIILNIANVLVNFVDSVMVGTLGDVAIASVGIGNQVFAVFNLLVAGVSGGLAIFLTRFWGANDTRRLANIVVTGLALVIPIMSVATILAISFPTGILRFFTSDLKVFETGLRYLQIVGYSYIPTGMCLFLGFALRSVDRIRYAVATALGALICNVLLNYLLIFGVGIFPELGIAGAAIATVIARTLQLLALIAIIYFRNTPIAIRSLTSFRWAKLELTQIVKISGFVVIREVAFGVGAAVTLSIYGKMGTDVTAGVNIAQSIENMAWIFIHAFGAAASVSVGQLIGSGQHEKAQKNAIHFTITGLAFSVILAGVLAILSGPLLSFYDASDSAITVAQLYLKIFVLIIIIRGPLKVLSGGIFSAGGDTRFVLFWDTVPMWLVIIGCYLTVTFGTPALLVIFLASIGHELIKTGPVVIRFLSRRWIHVI